MTIDGDTTTDAIAGAANTAAAGHDATVDAPKVTGVRGAAGWLPACYSVGLSLIVLGPLVRPGYVLQRDAVSTPRSYLTDAALGLGEAAPRAVPQDGLVAALSHVVDGGVLVTALLVVGLWAAGWGAAMLARELLGVFTAPQLVASTAAVWNPYVAERLLQGHWSLLVGYGALPWTVLAAHRLRSNDHNGQRVRWWAALAGCLAAGGLTPTGGLVTGGAALLVIGRRRLLPAAALWCAASAPWLVAAALSGHGTEAADPAGAAAFAARAEPFLGTLGSLAGLGGIWNAAAVPVSRTTPIALVATALLLTLVATGVAEVARGPRGTAPGTSPPTLSALRAAPVTRRVLLGLSVFAVALPALGATAWGLRVGESATAWVPGAGLLRDTQKYVALAVPAYTLCVAAGCRAVGSAFARAVSPASWHAGNAAVAPGSRPAKAAAALLFVVALVAPLLDLAWGVAGTLRPVQYPPGWQHVAGLLTGDGDVAVLPGGMFRIFAFRGATPVLDPAPRLLPRTVLQTGELRVTPGAPGAVPTTSVPELPETSVPEAVHRSSGPEHRAVVVAGESQRARRVEQQLLAGAPPQALAAEAVGWVLWERTTPGPLGAASATLAQLPMVWADSDLALYRVPGPIRAAAAASPARRATAVAAHVVWALLLSAGVAAGLTRPTRWVLARVSVRGGRRPARKHTVPPSQL